MAVSQGASHDVFAGTDRFELISRLGAGGMGIVYEVHDRSRRVRLALKSLQHVSPREILRLKSEFRALRDLHHPNLIRLGELFEHRGDWFFTMELIEGVDFLRWVRQDADDGLVRVAPAVVAAAPASRSSDRPRHTMEHHTLETVELREPAPRRASGTGPSAALRDPPGFDEERLRTGLRGLASGLAALHRAQMAHRDVKPSNVLVEPDGRVVLLDFGVVGELEGHELHARDQKEIVGTWAYMAPEQGAGRADASADWYAVGVMLFQALTGALPFPPGRDGFAAKLAHDPPSPDELTRDLPRDLVHLCESLLARHPAHRPGDREVLAALGAHDSEAGAGPAGVLPGVAPFVGRREELAQLGAALARVRSGRPAWVVVSGESGVGKTALVRRFLRGASLESPAPLVLAGRCDPHEFVPYNAFDGVVDQLARALERVPARELAELVPPGLDALGTIVPVLRSLAGFASEPGATAPALDARTVGFAALAELLVRLSRRAPLVLVIDDLQRADPDSLALLRELTQRHDAPAMLLVGTARTQGEPLAALAALPAGGLELALTGLDERDAAELLYQLGSPEDHSATLIRESAGHPMFLLELARVTAGSGTSFVHLDEALWQRIGELSADGRRLIETVALAGTPLSLELAAAASQLGPAEIMHQLFELRTARLLRIGEGRGRDLVEPYHDRVAETVRAHLAEGVGQALHGRLARALAEAGAPPALCAHHYAGAGEAAQAASYAIQAARRAAAALAFDHAADWFRTALALGRPEVDERRALTVSLGEALALAGRPVLAGEAFEAALALGEVPVDEARDLHRRAAEQYLKGGVVDRGTALTRAMLADAGLSMPASAAGALRALLLAHLRLRFSSLRFVPRPATAQALLVADTTWTVASSYATVDSLIGALFAARGPLVALASGDAARSVRAVAAAASAAAIMVQKREARRLLEAARRVGRESPGPLCELHLTLAESACKFFLENDWRGAYALTRLCESHLQDAGRTAGFEHDLIVQLKGWSMNHVGEHRLMREQMSAEIRAAARNGRLFLETTLRTYFPELLLMDDRAADARADVLDALAAWQRGRDDVGNQFFYAVRSLQLIATYAGDLDEHAEDLDARWQRFWGSLLARVPGPRFDGARWHAHLALTLCARARRRGDQAGVRRYRALGDRLVRVLRASPLPIAPIFVEEALALRRIEAGDVESGMSTMRALIGAIEARGMSMVAATIRCRLAAVIGGDEGEALRKKGITALSREGWARPERFVSW